jgi:hypothetical protein
MYTYGQPRWLPSLFQKRNSKPWNNTTHGRTGNVLYAELLDRKLGLDSEFRGEGYILLTVLCVGWNCKCDAIVVHTTDPQASFLYLFFSVQNANTPYIHIRVPHVPLRAWGYHHHGEEISVSYGRWNYLLLHAGVEYWIRKDPANFADIKRCTKSEDPTCSNSIPLAVDLATPTHISVCSASPCYYIVFRSNNEIV